MTPLWLQAAGLVLWGFATGHWMTGALLAALQWLLALSGLRVKLNDQRLNRIVDLSVIGFALTLIGFLVSLGVPNGLFSALGWLPAVLFPLLLIEALGEAPLRMRHVAISLRHSAAAAAQRPVQLGTAYFAVTVLAASAKAEPSSWLLWPLAALMVAWLLVMRRGRAMPHSSGATIFALSIAVVAAYGMGIGLQRAQGALQEIGVDLISDADTDPYQSRTHIGDLGRLKLSGRILWRVEQTVPPEIPLRLRTGVFSTYIDGTWVARQDSFHVIAQAPEGGPPLLTLHGRTDKGRALVPVPPDVGYLAGDLGHLEKNAYGVVRASDAPPLLDVAVHKAHAGAALEVGAADLSVPPGVRGLLQRLPELAALEQRSEHERVAGLKAWFATNFRYTLFLGDTQRGGRDLERFLLVDRAGHCEYFATSTVLLLRALRIPARYVTGYSVQEYSQREQLFVIRQRHAHAWVEALVDGNWVEVDTTPSTWISAEEDTASFWQPVFDLANFISFHLSQWERSLVTEQYHLLVWPLGIAMAVAIGWLGGIRAKRMWKLKKAETAAIRGQQEPASAEVRAFRELEQKFAALGLSRSSSEPARAWLNRVAREGASILDKRQVDSAREIVDALYRDRYAQ
jgi:transglutaminase-like putative cysteine protease